MAEQARPDRSLEARRIDLQPQRMNRPQFHGMDRDATARYSGVGNAWIADFQIGRSNEPTAAGRFGNRRSARFFRNFAVCGVAVLLLGAGCGKKDSSKAKATNTVETTGNPLTAPVDYLGAVGKAKKTAEKTADSAALTQALQQFISAEGRKPKDLQELVTEGYLDRVPQAPRGMQFFYDPQSGQLRIVQTR